MEEEIGRWVKVARRKSERVEKNSGWRKSAGRIRDEDQEEMRTGQRG